MKKVSIVVLCLMLALSAFAPMTVLADNDAPADTVLVVESPTDSVQTADVGITATATTVKIWGQTLDGTNAYYHNGVSGAQGTADNNSDGANAHYVQSTGVLTLTGLNVQNFDNSVEGAIRADGDITIALVGDSTISTFDNAGGNTYGVYVVGSLTVSGSGKLTATAGTGTNSYGVYVYKESGNGGGNISVSSGSIEGTGGQASGNSCGVYAYDNTGNDGGKIMVDDNGRIEGISRAGTNSYGVYANGSITVSDGSIEGVGGQAAGTNSNSYGVQGLSVTANANGSITGIGDTAAKYSRGVAAMIDITANTNGNITGIADEAENSYGVFANGGSIVIGGSIDGTGGQAVNDSYGVYVYSYTGSINVNTGGYLRGVGVTGNANSYGVCVRSSEINISSGTTVLVQGHKQSFSSKPTLTGVTAAASTSYDGSGFGSYVDADWANYKFFRTPYIVPDAQLEITPASSFVSGKAPADQTVTVVATMTGFNASNSFDRATMGSTELDLGSVGNAGTDGSVSNGSIVIHLNQNYLNGLSVGTHTLRISLKGLYTGTILEQQITVTTAPAPPGPVPPAPPGPVPPGPVPPVPPRTTPPGIPDTGDSANISLWAAVAIVAAGILVIAVKKRRA